MGKKLLALLLTLLMVFSVMPLAVMAADTQGPQITILNSSSSKKEETTPAAGFKDTFSDDWIEAEYKNNYSKYAVAGTRMEFPDRWEIGVMSPATWNNSYAIANRKDGAETSGSDMHFNAGSGWMYGSVTAGGFYFSSGQLIVAVSHGSATADLNGNGKINNNDRPLTSIDCNTLVRYTAPYYGTVTVDAEELNFYNNWNSVFCILHNGQPVGQFDKTGFSYANGTGWFDPDTAEVDCGDGVEAATFEVKKGDTIDFVIRSTGTDASTNKEFKYEPRGRTLNEWTFSVTYADGHSPVEDANEWDVTDSADITYGNAKEAFLFTWEEDGVEKVAGATMTDAAKLKINPLLFEKGIVEESEDLTLKDVFDAWAKHLRTISYISYGGNWSLGAIRDGAHHPALYLSYLSARNPFFVRQNDAKTALAVYSLDTQFWITEKALQSQLNGMYSQITKVIAGDTKVSKDSEWAYSEAMLKATNIKGAADTGYSYGAGASLYARPEYNTPVGFTFTAPSTGLYTISVDDIVYTENSKINFAVLVNGQHLEGADYVTIDLSVQDDVAKLKGMLDREFYLEKGDQLSLAYNRVNGNAAKVKLTAKATYAPAVYEIGGVKYSALADVLAAIEGGATGDVLLIADAVAGEPLVIPAGVTMTLDLGGHKIVGAFAAGSTTNHIYALENRGTLTIKDSVGGGKIKSRGIYNYGMLTLEGGTIDACDGNGGYAVNNESGSTFVMNGGKLIASYEDDYQNASGGFDATALDVPEGCTATLNGGVIESVTDFTFAISAAGTLNVPSNSTVVVQGNHGAISVSGGVTTVDGGTFKVLKDNALRTDNVTYVSGGKLVINGGTFVGDSDTAAGGSCVSDAAGGATINGGRFSGSSGSDVCGTTGTVINGGDFENLIETQHVAVGAIFTNGGQGYLKTEDGLVEYPLTETPDDIVDNIVGDETLTEDEAEDIVAEIEDNKALLETNIAPVAGVKKLVVALKGVTVSAKIPTKIIFDVKPVDATGSVVTEHDEITFRLPVPASVTAEKAKVYHEGEFLGFYSVLSENGDKYVEIKTESFSEFAIDFAEYLTLEDFVAAVIAAGGVYDGNGVTVKIEPASGDARTDADVKIPNRLQKYGNPEVYYAQYQRFADLTDVEISNVNFVFVPAAVTVVDAWNTAGATTTASNINGELQFMNAGSVSLIGCTFDKVAVSPINASAVKVDDCAFTGLDAYAIKDISASEVLVYDSTFTDCNGGFWMSDAPTTLTVTGNTFANVGRRGAIQFSASGDYTATAMTVTGNTVSGGALLWQLNETVSYEQVSAILENNTYETAYVSGSVVPELPTYVAQIGDVKYETLQEAINAADGMTVVLLADVEISTGLVVPKGTNVIIDGNGHKITPAADFVAGNNGAALTLANGDAAYNANSIYTVKNLTFEGFSGLTRVLRANFGDITVEKCTFNNNSVSEGVITSAYADLTVVDCTFDGNTSAFAIINVGSDNSVGTTLVSKVYDSTFANNKADIAGIYLAVSAVVEGNYFVGNEHTGSNANGAAVLAGPYGAGVDYTIAITDNAFADTKMPSVFVEDWSAEYGTNTSFDLSSNYWGGGEPDYGFSGTPDATVEDYYTTYVDGVLGGLNEVKTYVAQIGDVKYETLAEALAAAAKTEGVDTVVLLADVTESIEGFANVILTTNVAGGVTVTNTYTGWTGFNNVTVGAGVTVDSQMIFSSTGENLILGTLTVSDTYYHGYDAKTIIRNGGKVATTNGASVILRYNKNADSGIYVYGDGDDSTVEFDCDYYIAAYSGTFYAENATVESGYVLLKNSNDNNDNATHAGISLKLDNSDLTVVGAKDGQDSFIIDGQASITMKDGSAIADVRDFIIEKETILTLNVEEGCTISATYMNIAEDVPFEKSENADGSFGIVAKSVVDVNGVGYADLAKAIDAWKANGGTLKLLASVDAGEGITLNFPEAGAPTELTLDLNGFTVVGSLSTLWVSDGYVVTVKDSSAEQTGKILSTSETDEAIAINRDGKVILNGGYVSAPVYSVFLYSGNTAGKEVFVMNGGEIYHQNGNWFGLGIKGGKATINGGKVTGDKIVGGGGWNIYVYENGQLDIKGGEFRGMISGITAGSVQISGGTFSYCGDPNDYFVTADLAPGYDVKVVDGAYVVYALPTSLEGSGTESDPYLINNLDDLKLFRSMVNTYQQDGSNQFRGKYFKLTADIDLAGMNWTPIGKNSVGDHQSFLGHFDGAGHTIYNMTITGADHLGFFANVGDFAGTPASVKNLNFHNVTINGTGNYVGTVIANGQASTTVDNVHVTGEVNIVGGGYVGGLVGHAYIKMNNVSVKAEGTIKSTFWCCGGILGYAGEGSTNITNATVEGTGNGLSITSAAGALGAIVGRAEDNNGTQPISGSNLSAKNVEISTYKGAYGDEYADNGIGYLFGGANTSKLTGTLVVEDVEVATFTGEVFNPVDAVASVDGKVFFDLQAAIDAAEAGDEIVLLRDVTVESTITVEAGKAVELDLAGFDITVNDGNLNLYIEGKLTIDDSVGGGVSTFRNHYVKAGGELIVNGGILQNVATNTAGYAIYNCGTLTINGGEIRSVNATNYAICLPSGSSAVVNDGKIYGRAGIAVEGGVLTVNGGEISSTETAHSTSHALYIASGEVTVNGGTFHAKQEYNGFAVDVTGGKLTINGGTFVGYHNGATLNNCIYLSGNAAVVEIKGGNFNYGIEKSAANATLAVSGGIFGQAVKQEFCAEGYIPKDNGDGTYGVEVDPAYGKVAVVDGVYYATLQEAIDAAQAGDEIVLLADVDMGTTGLKIVGKAVTLDLNGKTVSGQCLGGERSLVYVENGAKLTLKDSATGGKLIYTPTANGLDGYTVDVKGEFVLESGTVELAVTEQFTSWGVTYAVNVRPNEWGTPYTGAISFVMNGGKVVSADAAIRLASSSNKSKTVVFEMNGGSVEAVYDAVFVQQGDAANYDTFNVTVNGGSLTGRDVFRIYGMAPTTAGQYYNFALNGGTMTRTGDKVRDYLVGDILCANTGLGATVAANGKVTASAAIAQANAPVDGFKWVEENGVFVLTECHYVAQVGDVKFESLQAAIDAADGKTVVLLADVELAEALVVAAGKNITVDLNGKTVSYTSNVVGEDMITNYGTLTIMDSVGGGKITYCNTDTTGDNVTVSTISNCPGGILTVKNGTIENTSSNANAFTGKIFPFAIDNLTNATNGAATVTIEGGKIISNYRSIRLFANSQTDMNTVNINGGEFVGQVWLQAPNAKAQKVTLAITDGTFAPAGNDKSSVFLTTLNGTAPIFSVTGGNFTTKLGTDNADLATANGGITGGTFATDVSNLCAAGYVVKDNGNGTYGVEVDPAYGKVAVVDGVYYATLQEAIDAADGKTVVVLADVELAEGLVVAAGKNVTIDLNGKTISGVSASAAASAVITNRGTLTIKDEVGGGKITAFAQNPDTDIECPAYANNTITNHGTLNLYSGTIENSTGDEARACFPIDNNSTVGNAIVNIYGGVVTGRGAIRQFANSTTYKNEVNILGGTVSGTSYAIWVQNPGSGDPVASLNIQDGTLDRVLLQASTSFDIAITGGTIKTVEIWEATGTDRDPAGFITGGTFSTDVTDFCVAGKIAKKNADGTYGIVARPIANIPGHGTIMTDSVGGTYIHFNIYSAYADESIVLKLYAGDVLIATCEMVNPNYLRYTGGNGTLTANFEITRQSSTWETVWLGQNPDAAVVPTRVELYVDGEYLDDAPMGFTAEQWAATEGVKTYVAEVDGVKFESLQAAIDAADGKTVVVLADVELAEGLVVAAGKNVTIDLNGKTISGVSASAAASAVITNRGTLTIKDEVGGGKITAFAQNPDTDIECPAYANNTITNHGTLYLVSGTIENSSGDEARACFPIDNNSTTGNAIVVISGGKVVGRGAIRQFANSTTYENSVTVTGGVIEGSSYAIWVQNPGSGDPKASLTIEGGKLARVLLDPNANVDVAITGGTIKAVEIWEATGTDRDPAGFITGGTFSEAFDASFCEEGFAPAKNADGTYGVGKLPNAETVEIGSATVVPEDSYYIYDLIGGTGLTTGTAPFDLQIIMQFLAKDSVADAEANAFGNYTTDFFLSISGMEGDSIVADGCYLAGYYASFGTWVVIPLDGFEIENGKVYPVISSVGFDFKYTDICGSVQDFICGIYLSDEILAANPNLKVSLELGLSESFEAAQSANRVTVDEPYVYDVEEIGASYVAQVESAGSIFIKNFATLQEAIDAAEAGDVIKLLVNVTLTEGLTVSADKAFTLDLNGKTVSYTTDVLGEFLLENRGNVTIDDSSDAKDGKLSFVYNGQPDTSYGKMNGTIQNLGTLTIKNGTVENASAKMSHANYAINTNAGATLNVEGGKVLNPNGHAIRMVSFGTALNTVNITGGYIEGTRAVNVQIPGSASATTAPEMALTITGGELKATDDVYALAVYAFSNGQSAENLTINIEGGIFNGNVAINGAATTTMQANALAVTGGTFNGDYGVYSYADDATVAASVISITGGTFATNYCEYYAIDDGFGFELNAEGTYNVVEGLYAAEVNGVPYATLEQALRAATAGQTVTVLADVDMSDAYAIIQSGTILDLNGHTVKAFYAAAFGQIIDSGETKGLLEIAKDNLAMTQATYPMLPVYNEEGTGYVFVSVNAQLNVKTESDSVDTVADGSFVVKFRPTISGGGVVTSQVFGDGAEDNGVSYKIYIHCFNEDGTDVESLDFKVSDGLIASAHSGSKMIKLVVNNAAGAFAKYQVEIVVESNTGVAYTELSEMFTVTSSATEAE